MNANPDEIRFLADALQLHFDLRKRSPSFCAIAPADVNHNGVVLRGLIARAAIAAERVGLDSVVIIKLNRVVSDADLAVGVEAIERLGVKLAALEGDLSAGRHDDRGQPASPDSLTGEEKALALLVAHPGWSDVKIAQEVPCSRSSLYRWATYRKAREALEQGRQNRPRGTKDRDGNLDAW